MAALEGTRRSGRRGAVLAAVVLVALAGCGGDDDQSSDDPTPGSTTTVPDEPVGVIAIGHSGLTGENSDPARPRQDALENSWATGTNPDVNSVYLRLVAVHPDTEGHVANTAKGGATAGVLAEQAEAALQEVPAPELIIVQTMDNDITCGASDDDVAAFGQSVAKALAVITEGSPESHILFVSQPGRPETDIATIPLEVRAAIGGTGPCDVFDPDGNTNEDALAVLTSVIEAFEAEQARVCAEVPLCSTDQGAFTELVREPQQVSSDGNHASVEGHARLAELAWPEVERLLELRSP